MSETYADWRDERGPYFRVNYGNGQCSEVFYGAGARKRADAHATQHGTWFVQWYDVVGGEWFTARA